MLDWSFTQESQFVSNMGWLMFATGHLQLYGLQLCLTLNRNPPRNAIFEQH